VRAAPVGQSLGCGTGCRWAHKGPAGLADPWTPERFLRLRRRLPIALAAFRPVRREWAGWQKRLPPKRVLNFQVPDRPFAVNRALEIEVPNQTRLLSRGGLNVATRCCTALPPCR